MTVLSKSMLYKWRGIATNCHRNDSYAGDVNYAWIYPTT